MNTMIKRISFSVLSLGALGLITLSIAHAADRVDLTADLLNQIEALPNGTKRISVYSSHRIRANFKKLVGSGSTTSNGDLELSSGKKDIDVVLKRKTRGQIFKIERADTVDMITANFDPDCKDESCMFRFTRNLECSETPGCDQFFYLTTAPNAVSTESGYGFSYAKSRGKDLFQKPVTERPHLDIRLSELTSSEHKRKPLDGIDPDKTK